MHHMRLALIPLFVLLTAVVVWAPPSSNAQSAPPAATAQPALVSQGSSAGQVALPTPASIGPTAPIGERTQQVLLIIGGVILVALLLGGGIYLRRRWIAGGW